ncbi:hypothetical protein ACFE04_012532 [Oxalis oulophora]
MLPLSCGSYSDLGSGSSARDTTRVDSSSLPLNSRRSTALIPYKLKWDKETLNSRLGPSDFFLEAPNCPEETLNREYVQSGYMETVGGLEDAREISLSQAAISLRKAAIDLLVGFKVLCAGADLRICLKRNLEIRGADGDP